MFCSVPYLGSSYASALEVLPRLLLGAILINTARWWTGRRKRKAGFVGGNEGATKLVGT